MQLTQFTDLALRTLIYLSKAPDQFATITEISDYFSISRNHLVKVVHHLSSHQVIITTRGKNGGIHLAKLPTEINIGSVVRLTEQNQAMVECFNKDKNNCIITPGCRLQNIMHEALDAFLKVLDNYTLADATGKDIDLSSLIQYKESALKAKKEPATRAQKTQK